MGVQSWICPALMRMKGSRQICCGLWPVQPGPNRGAAQARVGSRRASAQLQY